MIIAIFNYPGNGYEVQQKKINEIGLKIGDRHEVENINMGSWSTTVYLKGFSNIGLNSVFFDFEEDGKPLDIYKDGRFNDMYH